MRRHKAREFALQILFAMENQGLNTPADVGPAMAAFLKSFSPRNFEENSDTEYMKRLLRGILSQLAELDKEIEKYSENWKLYRMTKIDRNVLRIGTYELQHFTDVPPRVTIDECVELAKSFGTEESSAFVNGILDRILQATGRKEI